RSPADNTDAVAKPIILQPVEGHLPDELGPQRLPGQVAILRPAARTAGSTAALETGAATQWLEQADKLAALGIIEARRMTDVLKRLAAIDTEQERAYPFAVV